MKSLVVKTPGKLYIAGEYAVLYGAKAMLMQTKKTLDVTITSSDCFLINHRLFSLEDQTLEKSNPYLYYAVNTAHLYLSNMRLKPYHIKIHSELNLPNSTKLGLGTSGALTIGIIEAILQFHDVSATNLELYKLGVFAQYSISKASSYGDLAVSAFKSNISYRMFDRQWFEEVLTKIDLALLIKQSWPNLKIEVIEPLDYPFLVIYTNQAAKSSHFVSAIQKHDQTPQFKQFLIENDLGFKKLEASKSFETYQAAITGLHDNFAFLQRFTDVPLITEAMDEIEGVVKLHHGVMKFSGAGGGDSVLAFFSNLENLQEASKALKSKYPILNDFF